MTRLFYKTETMVYNVIMVEQLERAETIELETNSVRLQKELDAFGLSNAQKQAIILFLDKIEDPNLADSFLNHNFKVPFELTGDFSSSLDQAIRNLEFGLDLKKKLKILKMSYK